jgi:hypothetical protein
MKDKLYDFLNKRTGLFLFLFAAGISCGIAGGFQDNYLLVKIGAALVGLCYIAIVFLVDGSMRRSNAKARQRLQDQRNSASPHWDGTVRSVEDIEPRLSLLQARIEQDQKEVSALHEASRRIAAINRAANP